MSATPRPWGLFYEGSGDYLITGPNGEEIASLSRPDAHFASTGPGSAINEANATLIVRRVNAFDALLAVAKAADRNEEGGSVGSNGTELEWALHELTRACPGWRDWPTS